MLAELSGDFFGGLGADRAAIDDQATFFQAGRGLAYDLLDVEGIGDAEHQYRRGCGQVFDGSGMVDLQGLREVFCLAFSPVPYADGVALRGEILHHPGAHDSESYESDGFWHRGRLS